MAEYYANVNHDNKTITINMGIEKKPEDEAVIDFYSKQGYKLRFKSVRKSAQMKQRQADKETYAQMKEILTAYPDLEEQFNAIAKGKGKGHGVFAAKAWYQKTAKPEIEKRAANKE